MSAITPELVKQVALLARLKLEGDALSRTAAQLDEILTYVQRFQAVPTDDVAPTTHVLPLSNVLRKDEPHASLPQHTIATLAPAAQPPFVKVPKVIES